MTTIIFNYIFITLILFSVTRPAYSSTFITLDQPELKNKIYNEVLALKNNPEKSQLLSALGFVIADEKTNPELYCMVNNLAQKLSIPVPRIVIFKGNPLWTAGEHCGFDLKCNAFAFSLAKNFGLICLGEDVIQCLSPQELEAIIAHELSHISNNHVPKQMLLGIFFHLIILKIFEQLGFCNKAIWTTQGLAVSGVVFHVSAIDLVPFFLDIIVLKSFSRYCEKEADLTAITVLDDPKQLSNGLFKIGKITELKKRVIADALSEFTSSHPLTKHRAQYIEEQLLKKEKLEPQVEASAA